MPSSQPAPSPSPRRLLSRALLCLALAMTAAPWWQQAFARSAVDLPAMAICSATGAGNAPSHLAAGHCQLCCGSQAAYLAPESALVPAAAGISYPLAPAARAGRSAGHAPGMPRARAPPEA